MIQAIRLTREEQEIENAFADFGVVRVDNVEAKKKKIIQTAKNTRKKEGETSNSDIFMLPSLHE